MGTGGVGEEAARAIRTAIGAARLVMSLRVCFTLKGSQDRQLDRDSEHNHSPHVTFVRGINQRMHPKCATAVAVVAGQQ